MKATVTTSTSKVDVSSYHDDVLIHPKNTQVSVSVPNSGGGGTYQEKDFQTYTLWLGNGIEKYQLAGGKQFFLLGYSCTADDLRVRGYADEQSRENDYARPLSQDPLSLGGVLFELVTMSGSYLFSNPVTCYGNQSMPLLVQGTSLPASISFFVY